MDTDDVSRLTDERRVRLAAQWGRQGRGRRAGLRADAAPSGSVPVVAVPVVAVPAIAGPVVAVQTLDGVLDRTPEMVGPCC